MNSHAQNTQCIAFNLAPATYTHCSWFDVLPHGALSAALLENASTRSQVSGHILESRGLTDSYYNDFLRPRTRFALLDSPSLEMLCLFVGAALRSAELRRVLDGKELQRMRASLGAEVLDFALKRVPFMGRVPAFGYEPGAKDDLRLRLMAIGFAFLICPIAMQNTAFLKRVALKLPRQIADSWTDTFPDQICDPDAQDIPVIARKIIREYLPSWQPLFD